MSTWNTQTIAELGKVVTGRTPPSAKPEQFGDKYPFITPSDIEWGVKYVETDRLLSEKGQEAYQRIVLPKKSVCVVCIASIGKVCATTEESVTNQQINSIVVDEESHDPDFVFYLASLLQNTLKAYAGGSATPIVNKGTFSKIKLQVPERGIQRKTAAILTAYDDLIETNKRRIALLEKMAEELYREWFVRMRFPGHQNIKFVKGVPEGWTIKRIGNAFRTTLGGTPARENPNYWGGSVPWINSGEINKRRITVPSEYIPEPGLAKSAAKLMPPRTTVIAITGATLGQVSLLEIKTSANQSVVGINDPSKVYDLYVYEFVRTNIENIIAKQSGGGQQHINKAIVEGEEILLPDKALMKSYNSVATPLYDLDRELRKESQMLIEARDLLLPRLISGRLSVKDLDIQFPPSMAESEPVEV